MSHISACLLYQYAKANNFDQNTWVYLMQYDQTYDYLGDTA
jgi:hypothetical protein